MAVVLPTPMPRHPPYKRQRRTATSVLAGDFDPRPARDVLTSLLNGVPVNTAVEKQEQEMEELRREKREREKGKRKAKPGPKSRDRPSTPQGDTVATPETPTPTHHATSRPVAQPQPIRASPFWGARPAIQLQAGQRSISVTPPPMPSSPPTTPGPSISSSTSRTSSKRPHTPTDDFDSYSTRDSRSPAAHGAPRRKRIAVRKGWKGWVEGSPPPSEKLINLDAVTVLHERRTRSGKNFDAIGLGQDGWV